MQIKVQVMGQALKYFNNVFKMDRCLRWTDVKSDQRKYRFKEHLCTKKKNHFKLIILKLLYQVSITAKMHVYPGVVKEYSSKWPAAGGVLAGLRV